MSYFMVTYTGDVRDVELNRHRPGDDLDVWLRTQGATCICLTLEDAIFLSRVLPQVLAVADETPREQVGTIARVGPSGEMRRVAAPPPAGGSDEPGGRR